MTDFDFVDDVEEIVHPLCLCINHDSSRIGVGHQKGYVIYQVHRNDKDSEDVSLYTSIEAVYPPPPDSTDTTSVGWDMPMEHSQVSQDKNYMIGTSTSSPQGFASCVESREGGDTLLSARSQWQQQSEIEKMSQEADVTPRMAKSRTSVTSQSNKEARALSPREADAILMENGIGVMALLCRTQFVAVVGGGPYPIGPRNVVKLFVSGALWADHSFTVGDDVEALHLDHRLIIILTTAGLRLHSFETRDCLLFVPNMVSPTASVLPPSRIVTQFWNGSAESNAKLNSNTQNRTGVTAANTQTGVSLFHCTPIVIDYARKCLCYRSSDCGFSFVRYDAEPGVETRLGAELLATVSAAHTHSLASLAMDLSGDGSGGSGQRWLVASCSEWSTLIRIWQYCDRSVTGEEMERPVEGSESSSAAKFRDKGDGTPGTFVMIKEVRNASTPTPIFQLMFLGESFLSCIACNRLKIFFIGKHEEPKPYDISTKDPAKVMRAQNHHSSLHHLSLVSSYFSSEWAACECPLPLTDGTFLPDWIGATTGALRQHLLRGHDAYASRTSLVSSNAPASGDSAGNAVKTSNETTPPVGENDGNIQQGEASSPLDNFLPKAQQQCGVNVSPNWSGTLRGYVTSQMVGPALSTAGLAARWYLGGSARWYLGASGSAYDSPQASSMRLPPTGADSVQDCFQNRDYAILTEIAQALVVWWEKPAYWQLDCMTKGSAEAVTTFGGEAASMRTQKIAPIVLCCVTCDGSALRFNFDPIAGTVSCTKAVPTVRA